MKITFENLPQSVDRLYTKLENIERLIIQSSDQVKDEPNKLLSIDEASDYLNLAKPTIYSMVSKGKIPYMKKSKRLYFSKNELFEYVNEGRVKTISEIQGDAIASLSNRKIA